MARRISAYRVKLKRSYTVEEAADAVGATPQTVRNWIKGGLPALMEQRPTLVMGWALKEYLARTTAARKRPLQLGEFFCLTCKTACAPALKIADYVPISAGHGHLRAFCEVCEGTCTRLVRSSALPDWSAIVQITSSTSQEA